MDKKSLKRIVNCKVFLIETLSEEAEFILQHVHQANLITLREYKNLTDISEREKRVINLLDKLMGKGEETCRNFIDLLRNDSILEICPTLKDHAIFDAPVQVSEYKISRIPRGICVIINNVHFTTMMERSGSDEDQKYLDKVFHWLGFDVVVHRNKTADEMKNLLTDLGKTVDGDCFVCCVLSHGKKEGVFGADGDVVSVDEIREPFTGQRLAGKPKLFFIQACRGRKNQLRVKVQADSPEDGESEMEVDGDDFEITIPADTDFLIARSTTDGHYSYRKPEEGSWFIQSLCRNLEKHCPLGTDIQTILLCVNNDVSSQGINSKQMPVHEVAMRKKLILQPVNH
ncbi:caspase 20, apoptosis-related cysteine peptidase isoform X2 [Siphateles boraxobius]|uniref:caspase 20, apoptosis-related cysteine peptidase isoform X2 n=1 Tax=Siphateles boraxobius TaxID=180520 RepID=UPI004062AC43